MNNFEIIILALALIFSSWNTYLIAGLSLAEGPFVRKFSFSGIMFLMQFGMAGAGIWIGNKVSSPEMRTNIMISFGIILTNCRATSITLQLQAGTIGKGF
jgi:hypothetical protein